MRVNDNDAIRPSLKRGKRIAITLIMCNTYEKCKVK